MAGKRLKVYAAPGWGGKLKENWMPHSCFKFGYLRNVYLGEKYLVKCLPRYAKNVPVTLSSGTAGSLANELVKSKDLYRLQCMHIREKTCLERYQQPPTHHRFRL